jgi:hypothetical protein
MVRAMAISAAPSELLSAVKSIAHTGPRAIKANGLPATTKPVKTPVLFFRRTRRFIELRCIVAQNLAFCFLSITESIEFFTLSSLVLGKHLDCASPTSAKPACLS